MLCGSRITAQATVPDRRVRRPREKEILLPIGTKVSREFIDLQGQKKAFIGEVHNFSDPY